MPISAVWVLSVNPDLLHRQSSARAKNEPEDKVQHPRSATFSAICHIKITMEHSAKLVLFDELHRVNASSIAPGISGFSSLGSRQCIRAKKDRQCSLDMVTGIG